MVARTDQALLLAGTYILVSLVGLRLAVAHKRVQSADAIHK